MSSSLPPFSSLLLRWCNVSWVPAIFFISFISGLLRFAPCFSDVAMFHEFQPYSSFLSVPSCSIFLPASQTLQCYMSSSHIFHFFQFRRATFSSLLLRCCNVSWVPAIFFISFSSSRILHFFQFQPAPFSSLLLRCCNVSWVPAIFLISFSSSLLRFPPCFSDVAMFHEFQPYSSFLYFQHCTLSSFTRLLRFPPFFGCCNVSWVSGCTVLLFASQILQCFFKFCLLNLPPCFSDVEMFHEFQPYSFFLQLHATCYVFPHSSAMLQEFPPTIFSSLFHGRYNWVLWVSGWSVFLCFAKMSFYEFRPLHPLSHLWRGNVSSLSITFSHHNFFAEILIL